MRTEIAVYSPKYVEIESSRWNIHIHIKDADGKHYRFVASADSGLTWGDGIWFGNQKEYDEEIERVW